MGSHQRTLCLIGIAHLVDISPIASLIEQKSFYYTCVNRCSPTHIFISPTRVSSKNTTGVNRHLRTAVLEGVVVTSHTGRSDGKAIVLLYMWAPLFSKAYFVYKPRCSRRHRFYTPHKGRESYGKTTRLNIHVCTAVL